VLPGLGLDAEALFAALRAARLTQLQGLDTLR